jgi:hypothetical protein
LSLEHSPQRDRRRLPRRGRFEPLLIPILDAFEIIGVGKTRGFELIKAGTIETVMIGKRRFATRESLEKLATPQN